MAVFVKVRNINPLGPIVTVLDGEPREVGPGEVIQVTPEQAGTGPHWRMSNAGEIIGGHQETRERDGHLEVYDLGAGMLAQFTNWEAVDKTAKENV